MFKKSSLPKILLIITTGAVSLALLCVLGLFLYYQYITNNFNETHIENLIDAQAIQELKQPTLESGAIIKKSDYFNYTLFSNNYEEKAPDEFFTSLGENFIINNDLIIHNLITNHCESYYCHQHRLSVNKMPVNVLKAVMAIEDSRFLEHSGIDLRAIARALWKDIVAMKLVEGASTLTQQLVKNLFLTNEKSFRRKLNEMFISYYLEKKYSKEEIISIYLNEVFWGTFQGIKIKGVYSASLVYFNKRPSDLNFYESLILISMLKGPNLFNPKRIDLLKPRIDSIVKSIEKKPLFEIENDWIWSEERWKKWSNEFIAKNEKYFLRQIYNSKNFMGDKLDDWSKYIIWGEYEKLKEKVYTKAKDQKVDIGLKFGIFDKNFKKDSGYSFLYSKVERNKENAFKLEKHQIGSILKPIIYEIYLKLGKKLTDIVSTKPVKLKIRSGVWQPKEVSRSDEEEMTLLKALQKSKNNPVIRLGQELGFDNVEEKLIHYVPTIQLPLREYPAQLLGAIELTMWDVATMYQSFIKDVCDSVSSGEQEFQNSILNLQASNQETTIAHAANSVLKEITFFGKTGTTNQGKDAWFVGFDGKNIYTVWVGVETNANQINNLLSGAQSSFNFLQGYLTFGGKRLSESGCSF
jgi:penicillin-binding protein 1B